ncbi:Fe-S cluster assembly protein SufD [Lactobacillaceae bacterium Melli_B4]
MIKDKFMRQVSPKMVQSAMFKDEPDWMTNFRNAAFEQMADLALPTIDKMDYHTWRFIDQDMQRNDDVEARSVDINEDLNKYNLATVGKRMVHHSSNAEMREQGVVACDFQTAINEYADIIQPYIINQKHVRKDRLNCFEASMVNNGMFVYVPKGVHLTAPINLLMVDNNNDPTTTFSRIIIIADEGSKFDVVQKLGSVGEQRKITHINVDVYAKANSNVQFFSLDAMGTRNTSFIMRHSEVSRHAKMNWMVGSLNDGNTISDISTDLNGEAANGITRIVSIANHRQQQGINTRITNYGKHSDGEISQRGAILDRARIVFNGIGKVAHGAHGANNQQENSVLMLSDEASGDANPILLIDENDVVAGHKASIGKIDEQQLYYLMSRGIDPATAKKLVIRGFLGIILSHIPSEAIKQQMIDNIERKLANDQ